MIYNKKRFIKQYQIKSLLNNCLYKNLQLITLNKKNTIWVYYLYYS